jgi:membrane-bound lytic murein transglycosylase D
LEEPLQYDSVGIDYAVDLRLVAECTGASLEEIKLLNPELGRTTTPPRASYQLRVPPGRKETFLAEITSIPSDKRITWRKHEVKEGETLGSIAAVYRTSSSSIAAVNSFGSDSTLSAGQKVIIPIGRTSQVSYAPKTSYSSGYGQQKRYTVRSGDTLHKIASKFGASVQQLCAWNGISSGHVLRPGELLTIHYGSPVSTASKKIVYQVKKGDTLYQIASSYKIDVSSLKRWNNNKNTIYPGDRLTIYTK